MLISVLLAGGLSSRMGQDKSRLKIGDETLLQRAENLLRRCGSDRVLISGDIENYDCVPDLLPQCGPLGGIYSSLVFIKQTYGLDNSPVLIIPIDMPMLTENALTQVIAGVSDAQCCHYDGEVFPCVMRASESLFNYLQNAFSEDTALKRDKRSMKGLMNYLNAKSISTKDASQDLFLNINNPQDWQALFQLRHL